MHFYICCLYLLWQAAHQSDQLGDLSAKGCLGFLRFLCLIPYCYYFALKSNLPHPHRPCLHSGRNSLFSSSHQRDLFIGSFDFKGPWDAFFNGCDIWTSASPSSKMGELEAGFFFATTPLASSRIIGSLVEARFAGKPPALSRTIGRDLFFPRSLVAS